jgi:Transposase DDE domain group 1
MRYGNGMRERWPNTRIVWRGDAHYGRVEAMEWIEENGDSDYFFGLPGNAVLDKQVAAVADNLIIHHAKSSQEKARTYTSFRYQASTWTRPRFQCVRLQGDGLRQGGEWSLFGAGVPNVGRRRDEPPWGLTNSQQTFIELPAQSRVP